MGQEIRCGNLDSNCRTYLLIDNAQYVSIHMDSARKVNASG